MDAAQPYDVAISFLWKDNPFAFELHGKLEQTMRTFYFPRKQEELAGTDGQESMRAPFLGAHLSVVLYREPWGETPWTRVEADAIKDRCLKHGWRSLLFVSLDDSPPPKWLPDTHIRFNAGVYSIDELVGAIKARVQENGGVIAKPNPLVRAKLLKAESDLRTAEQQLFRHGPFIEETAIPQVNAIIKAIAGKAEELGREASLKVESFVRDRRCVVRFGSASLDVQWEQTYGNDISDAELQIYTLGGRLYLPGESRVNYGDLLRLTTQKFRPKLDMSRNLRWIGADKKQQLSDEDVLAAAIDQFLELVERVNKGKIPRPDRIPPQPSYDD